MPASFKTLLKVTAGKKTITKSYVIQMVFPRTSINWQFYKKLCHPNGVSTHLSQLTILQKVMSFKWCFNAPQSIDNFTKSYVIQMVFPRTSINWQFYKEICHPNGVSTHLNQLTILQRDMSSKWCFHATQWIDNFTKSYNLTTSSSPVSTETNLFTWTNYLGN